MIQKIFAIYDSKAEGYLQPFFLPAKGSAIRLFSDCVNDSKHAFGLHPEDYTLFEIGSFDDSIAALVSLDAPISVGNGMEFLKEITGSSR